MLPGESGTELPFLLPCLVTERNMSPVIEEGPANDQNVPDGIVVCVTVRNPTPDQILLDIFGTCSRSMLLIKVSLCTIVLFSTFDSSDWEEKKHLCNSNLFHLVQSMKE